MFKFQAKDVKIMNQEIYMHRISFTVRNEFLFL